MSPPAELCLLPIARLSEMIRQGDISPVEITDAYLERIAQLDGRLHSFLTVTAERARADARRADQEIRRGEVRGPLHGIPIALKDLFDTSGIRTTSGSRVLWSNVPTQDSTVTKRLADAGTVLLGKLMMHEFAMGLPYLDDALPPARNPWDLDRTPSGSSSGSGAALAAGLCAGSIGSDTGGSIRCPASQSGVVGLKPTYGLVSRHGVTPVSWTLDHVGPMARCVEDVALLLQAVAGHDPEDPASAQVSIPDYRSRLRGSAEGIRIGVPRSFIETTPGLEPDVLTAFSESVEVLRALGARVVEIDLPVVEHVEAIMYPIMLSEAAAFHQTWLEPHRHDYSRGFWQMLQPGLFYTATDYVQAQRGRALLCREFARLMSEVDVIATPSMPRTAPGFAEQAAVPRIARAPFTRLFNITGQPSISVPGGFDRQNLPIGLLLSGRAFDEPTILRTAYAYEQATEWHRRFPSLDVASPQNAVS